MNFSRRLMRLILAALFATTLAACANLAGPRTITFSEAELARFIERSGTLERRLLDVLDVRVSAPHLRLLPETNRLFTELDVATTERLSGKRYAGRIALDYALRYEPADQSIRLTQVRVGNFALDGVPNPSQRGLGRLGALIAENMLDNLPLYRFKPADLRTAEGVGLKPSAVTVTSRGVEVTLAPVR